MFRKAKYVISNLLGFPQTLTMGLKSASRDDYLVLGKVYMEVGWDAYRKHYCSAMVRSRDSQMKQIFDSVGYDSKDVAFGEMTQQVIYASERYPSLFLLTDNRVGKYFDPTRKQWIDYPDVVYKCTKCGEVRKFMGAQAVCNDDEWLLCCDLVMLNVSTVRI